MFERVQGNEYMPTQGLHHHKDTTMVANLRTVIIIFDRVISKAPRATIIRTITCSWTRRRVDLPIQRT